MTTELKGVLLNVEKNTVETKIVDGSLDDFYEALNCGYIQVISRLIGNRPFYIVFDEALNQWENEPILYGNLFICNIGEDGDLGSLDDEDCEHVMSYIKPNGYRLESMPKTK